MPNRAFVISEFFAIRYADIFDFKAKSTINAYESSNCPDDMGFDPQRLGSY